jgi:hypothetical protein
VAPDLFQRDQKAGIIDGLKKISEPPIPSCFGYGSSLLVLAVFGGSLESKSDPEWRLGLFDQVPSPLGEVHLHRADRVS